MSELTVKGKKRIGMIGGTFNPIHYAHLKIAELFTNSFSLGHCFFIPANISPFKTEDTDAFSVSPVDRAEMVRIAIKYNPKFDVDLFEIEKEGISYTYDTVCHFKKKYPGAELFLIIGDDQAADFKKWGNWEKILEETQLVIANRNPGISQIEKRIILDGLSHSGRIPQWPDFPYIDISSTGIREKIKKGESLEGAVPEKVINYIKANNLYR